MNLKVLFHGLVHPVILRFAQDDRAGRVCMTRWRECLDDAREGAIE